MSAKPELQLVQGDFFSEALPINQGGSAESTAAPKRTRFKDALAQGAARTQGGDEWPEPLPVAELPAVPPFDAAALLPPVLAGMVRVTAASNRTQPEKAMVPLYIATASLAAHCNCIRPDPEQPKWREWANMFGLLIDAPGTRKTPVMNAALYYVRQLGNDLRTRHEAQAQEAKDALAAYRIARENIETVARKDKVCSADEVRRRLEEAGLGTEPPAPAAAPLAVVSEATPQALEVKLEANPATLVAWDETRAFFAALRIPETGERIRKITKQCFSNSFLDSHTITRGDGGVEEPRASFFGNVQVDVLRRALVAEESNDDGLFSRFQLSIYACDAPRITKWAVPEDMKVLEPRANELMQAAVDWLRAQVMDGEAREWRFDAEAQALFVAEWEREQERAAAQAEAGTLPPLLASHFAKRTSFIVRAALLEAVLRAATGGDDGSSFVRREELERAIRLADYLRAHALRMYGCKNPAHTLLERLKKGDGATVRNAIGDGFTARDVYSQKWPGLKTAAEVQLALDELVRCGRLRAEKQGTGERGRPTVRYWMHPELLEERLQAVRRK